MNEVLQKLPFVKMYLDDILVHIPATPYKLWNKFFNA